VRKGIVDTVTLLHQFMTSERARNQSMEARLFGHLYGDAATVHQSWPPELAPAKVNAFTSFQCNKKIVAL